MSYDLINPLRIHTEGVAEVAMQPLETLAVELGAEAGLEPAPLSEEMDVVGAAEAILKTQAQPVANIVVYSDAHDHASWHINNYGWSCVLGIVDAYDAVPQGAYDYGDNSGWKVSKEESQRMAAAVRAYLTSGDEDLASWGTRLEELAAFLEQAAEDEGFEVW